MPVFARDERTGRVERVWRQNEDYWEAKQTLRLLWQVHEITEVKSNYPLWVARKTMRKRGLTWQSVGPWREDIIEITMEAMWIALRDYDPSKSRLSTWLAVVIDRALTKFLVTTWNKRRQQDRELIMSGWPNSMGTGTPELLEASSLISAEDVSEMEAFREWRCILVNEAIKQLADQHQAVIRARYGFEPYPGPQRSFIEVGKILGIDRRVVSRHHTRALTVLRSMNLPSELLYEPTTTGYALRSGKRNLTASPDGLPTGVYVDHSDDDQMP